jgi:GrpB-like predicted nucleotidyltransferase (UPF0157 family)
MARQTTAYYTLVVDRYGTSGPENERRIQRFVDSLEAAQNPQDKYMEVKVDAHQYDTVTESVD